MRMLIVEDDDSIAHFLTLSFEAECFAVDVAYDGEDGSFLGRTNDYDIILLDNILPKKNGYDVCKEIRAHGKITPILVLSATTDTEMKVRLLNAGADDYLTKPFSSYELLARVRALLRRPRPLLGDVLYFLDITLFTQQHRVKKGSDDVRLTRKEFMLLEYLMRNQGRVVSRAALLEHVWDIHADPFSNTIESHVFNVRKKLGIRGKKSLIQTISGRGYRMD
jgi:DNA-binding response OmpR family regulator